MATEDLAYEIVRRMRKMADIRDLEETYDLVNP